MHILCKYNKKFLLLFIIKTSVALLPSHLRIHTVEKNKAICFTKQKIKKRIVTAGSYGHFAIYTFENMCKIFEEVTLCIPF